MASNKGKIPPWTKLGLTLGEWRERFFPRVDPDKWDAFMQTLMRTRRGVTMEELAEVTGYSERSTYRWLIAVEDEGVSVARTATWTAEGKKVYRWRILR